MRRPFRKALFRLLAGIPLFLATVTRAQDADGWFPFRPPADSPAPGSALDLRSLNERIAGEHGVIRAADGGFVRSADGQPVRFWAVNGPPEEARDPAALRDVARRLARQGVNLVRVHRPVFDERGGVDPDRIRWMHDVVTAMKAEGIYTLFSIYFPLWFKPAADCPFLEGYDGTRHPFAALMFNPGFQARYRSWWEALLAVPGPDGRRLADEPAVMGLEVQNEDSFFFWTFADRNLPEPQLRMLESRFAEWAAARHGSVNRALEAWNGSRLERDDPAGGRLGFRPLWNIANERTARDRDTAAFLLETQAGFYRETIAFLRWLGFRGTITASNWTTADNRVLGPLEKLSYTVGDFIDRHGYHSCRHEGENAAWSIRPGHTYLDRSALRFDPDKPGGPRVYNHPVMDIEYDGHPSMISETTWNRPNRHRPEAPLFLAVYGALQGSDAVVHFAHDGVDWAVKPRFWMQPWTLMAPSQFGQFPVAARVFREGRVRPGAVLADLALNTNDLVALRGTPLPHDAAFDELRLKDVPEGVEVGPGQRIDPLVHFAGRAVVRFTNGPAATRLADLRPHVDRSRSTVTATTGELALDFGKGLLRIDAPSAQGVSGDLSGAGEVRLRDLTVASDLDQLHLVVVSLDGLPLDRSARMLLQVMTEERTTGWATEEVEGGLRRITSIGTDPWEVREVRGVVRFTGGDPGRLRITPLDLSGNPAGPARPGPVLSLEPRTLYYLVTR